MIRFWMEGGFWMFPVLLFGLVSLTAAVLQLALARRAALGGLVVGALALTLALGLLGSFAGWTNAFAAVAMVDPDQKGAILAVGFAEGLTPTILALVLSLIVTPLAGVALTVRANLAARR